METNVTKVFELVKHELPQFKALLALNAKPGTDVETIALQELEFLRMHAVYKPEVFECIPTTIIMAVKSVIKKNLSLDPSAGLVYVKTRNMKIKDSVGADKWVKGLEVTETANGLISINRQCGRILDVERPEVAKDQSGRVIGVTFKFLKPSYDQSGKPSTKWVEVSFDESDFYRWQRASHKENGRNKQDANPQTLNYANENYINWKGGIDPEFARAKAIRHGLKKLGTNQYESISNRINMTVDVPHEIIVDPSKDEAAAIDEAIVIETSNAELNKTEQVFVTVHDSVNIETIEL